MSAEAAVPSTLLESLHDSSAIVAIKGPDGRYLHVNRRYQEFFQVAEADVRGRTDDELDVQMTIDGPRVASEDEPLQLEYTVAPFGGRPALAVWRFAVGEPGGHAAAVCAVAAPIAETKSAREECARLMALAQATGAGEETPGESSRVEALHQASALAARRAHEMLNELVAERELRKQAEERIAELENALAAAGAAGAASEELHRSVEDAEAAAAAERELRIQADEQLADAKRRTRELERTLAEAEARLREFSVARDASAELRHQLSETDGKLVEERAALGHARDQLSATQSRITELESELTVARGELERMRAAAETHEQRAGATEELRRRLEEAGAAVDAERARADRGAREAHERLAAERAALGQARDQLSATQSRITELESELTVARGELEQVRAAAETHEQRVGAIAELRRRLEEAEAAVAAERAARGQTQEELSIAHSRIAQLESELSAAQANLHKLQDTEAAVAAERAALDRARAESSEAHSRIGELESALAAANASPPTGEDNDELRRQLDQAEAALAAERERAEQLSSEVAAKGADLQSARMQLVSERELRTQSEERLSEVDRRTCELEHALAGAEALKQELTAQPESGGGIWNARTQRDLTAALAHAADWREGVKGAIGVLGAACGWDAICVWRPEDHHPYMGCFAMWTAGQRRLSEFETATWQRRQPLAGSLLGEAFTHGHARWLAADPEAGDSRLQTLAHHGMRGALIVTVLDGPRPIAALELLTVDPTPPGDESIAATEAVALQLGHYWHLLSLGAQPKWRFGRM